MHLSISCLIDLRAIQVSKHETELQLLRRLRESYTSMMRGTGASEPIPAYTEIAVQIMKSKPPPHAGTLPMLYKFLLRNSGGNDQWLLQQTESFALNHGRPGKSLGEDIWEALTHKGLQPEIATYEGCLSRIRKMAPEAMSKLQINMQIGQFEISVVLSMLQILLDLLRFRA